MLLALAGGAIGIGLAYLALNALLPMFSADISPLLVQRIRVDTRVLLCGVGLTVLSGLVFGLVPAVRLASTSSRLAASAGPRHTDADHWRVRETLVVLEVALALVLLVSASLMVKSLARLVGVDKGFSSENVLSAAVTPPYVGQPTDAQWLTFYEQLRERAAQLPGVRSSSLALLLPLSERS
jgi:putative ABC transport system permease protein